VASPRGLFLALAMPFFRAAVIVLVLLLALVSCDSSPSGKTTTKIVNASSVQEPRDDIGDLQHFNSCKAVPRRKLSPKERCQIAALSSRCSRSDDCLVSCMSSPDGRLDATCEDGCFFTKRRDPDPPGWSKCESLPSIPGG